MWPSGCGKLCVLLQGNTGTVSVREGEEHTVQPGSGHALCLAHLAADVSWLQAGQEGGKRPLTAPSQSACKGRSQGSDFSMCVVKFLTHWSRKSISEAGKKQLSQAQMVQGGAESSTRGNAGDRSPKPSWKGFAAHNQKSKEEPARDIPDSSQKELAEGAGTSGSWVRIMAWIRGRDPGLVSLPVGFLGGEKPLQQPSTDLSLCSCRRLGHAGLLPGSEGVFLSTQDRITWGSACFCRLRVG